jgi:hypothetical protein
VQRAEGTDGLLDERNNVILPPTSVGTNKALPPAEVISRAVSSPSATRRPETTFAPSLANARAVALPTPEVPPVIRTVLFSKIFIVGLNLAVAIIREKQMKLQRAAVEGIPNFTELSTEVSCTKRSDV